MPPVEDSSRPHRHRYSVLTIRLAVVLVVDIHLSLRCVAAVLALFSPWVGCGRPCFATVRQWLLRLGLFLLRRVVSAVRGGWILIADHTVQLGPHKCFVVLGLPAARLGQTGFTLTHRDVTVLAVEVMEHSSGATIHPILQEVRSRVGSITQIVSDHGSDLTKGIRRLQQDHPEILATYDVRHLLACLLKAQLAPCPRWQGFVSNCGQTLPQLRQTSGNFLAPPVWRVKSRYLNLDTHVQWATRVLAWEEKADWHALSQELGQSSAAEARTWFEEKLGWLRDFRAEVEQWRSMLEAVELALGEVHATGLSQQTAGRFWAKWLCARGDPFFAVERFAQQIKEGLAHEGEKIPAGQTLLGSSDVIESLFGKYKEMLEKSPGGELSANVLLLSLLTASLTNSEIKQGLESVRVSEVREWIKEELGETPQAKKRRLLGDGPQSQDKAATDSEGPKAA